MQRRPTVGPGSQGLLLGRAPRNNFQTGQGYGISEVANMGSRGCIGGSEGWWWRALVIVTSASTSRRLYYNRAEKRGWGAGTRARGGSVGVGYAVYRVCSVVMVSAGRSLSRGYGWSPRAVVPRAGGAFPALLTAWSRWAIGLLCVSRRCEGGGVGRVLGFGDCGGVVGTALLVGSGGFCLPCGGRT